MEKIRFGGDRGRGRPTPDRLVWVKDALARVLSLWGERFLERVIGVILTAMITGGATWWSVEKMTQSTFVNHKARSEQEKGEIVQVLGKALVHYQRALQLCEGVRDTP